MTLDEIKREKVRVRKLLQDLQRQVALQKRILVVLGEMEKEQKSG